MPKTKTSKKKPIKSRLKNIIQVENIDSVDTPEIEDEIESHPEEIIETKETIEKEREKDIIVLENFNEKNWVEVLEETFKKAKSEVKIILKNELCHEFVDLGFGDYRYPSSVFFDILRTYCKSWEETREEGKQTFICKVKNE